ncbi:hypothetical protein [Mariniradius saccharolyticus]|nr:hypothetical protein [Mariniradius saccharolyticus]
MKFFQILSILAFGLLTFCHSEREIDTVNIDERAKEFIGEIDSLILKDLQHLYFIYRGPNGFLQNDSVQELRYNVRFSQFEDRLELFINRPERFIKDFSIKLEPDTSIFNLKLVKTDNKVQIFKNWDVLVKSVHPDSLSKKDPFEYFSSLNELKDKYDLVKISHASHLGEFVEFYFTTEDVLTFMRDTSRIDSRFKSIWIKKWDEGKWITQNWNLRKLKKPIEVGG